MAQPAEPDGVHGPAYLRRRPSARGGRFSEEVREGLARRGHDLRILGDWGGPGSAQAITIHPESNTLIGGSDPRRDGYAAAW